MSWQYSDGNPLTGALNADGVVRNLPISANILSQYLPLSHAVNAAAASCYQHDCRSIPGYRSMPAGASAINWRWSVQWCITVTVQVCLRHRKPCTSEYAEEKRREHNLIYAAVNLDTRVYLIIEDCAWRFVLLKLTTNRHKASRGLFTTAELLVQWSRLYELQYKC